MVELRKQVDLSKLKYAIINTIFFFQRKFSCFLKLTHLNDNERGIFSKK